MSIGLCADQYALELLPAERIVSVTWLSREGSEANAALARQVSVNRQTAEEVLAGKPDIVLVDAFTPATTRAMLERVGQTIVEVPIPNDLPAILTALLTVGERIDASPRAERLAADLARTLAQVEPIAPRPRVASWDGSGQLPPAGSLYDAAVTAAGGYNLGRDPLRGPLDPEALLKLAPDLLLHDSHVLAIPGRQADRLGHPAIRRRFTGQHAVIPQEAMVCGTPATIRAVADLNRQFASAG